MVEPNWPTVHDLPRPHHAPSSLLPASKLGEPAESPFTRTRLVLWRFAPTTETPDDATWRPTLRATGGDAFVVEPGVRESGEPCTFQRRDDGRVRSVMLGPVTLSRLDPVE